MKARAVANGNIIDLPDDSPLIGAGIYEPVKEDEEEEAEAKPRKSALRAPEKPVETVAHADVMTTESALAQPTRARRQRKRK